MPKKSIPGGNIQIKSSPSELQETYQAGSHLVIFRRLLEDPIVAHFLELLRFLENERKQGPRGIRRIADSYAGFFSGLARLSMDRQEPTVGTVWQNHLLNLILDDENSFSESAARNLKLEEQSSLTRQVQLDLQKLQTVYQFDSRQLLSHLRKLPSKMEWVEWDNLSMIQGKSTSDESRRLIKQQFHTQQDWGGLVEMLRDYFLHSGVGIFGRFRAFHWKRTPKGGVILPIPEPDPIRLTELLGYDDQKQLLLQNTAFFLSGFPANNVFIYGDRGTGKSSAIKALLHQFPDRPLRMLEISREDLFDLPDVMNTLRARPEYFVVFIDDLSFEEGETQYKTLKAVLEGSLEARPRNVVVYATSNRRHLIKESFSDRALESDGEIRPQDTLQEKVSLSDRFGIQLVFVAPDQDEFLHIVRSMAQRRQLSIPEDVLKRKALLWVQRHNTRCGRTARQFVDYLSGELETAVFQENP
jgi:predicted AAA+ superfamily ATPase